MNKSKHTNLPLPDWLQDDPESQQAVLELVFDELKAIASRQLRQRTPITLQTTEVANEAYIRLRKQQQVQWANRTHFFSIAARLIRRILVDQARRKEALKRGHNIQFVNLEAVNHQLSAPENFPDWLELDAVLQQLEAIDSIAAKIVELRIITGMKVSEIANDFNVSTKTITRKWNFARSWLRNQLQDPHDDKA